MDLGADTVAGLNKKENVYNIMSVTSPVHVASLVDDARANDTFYTGVSPAVEGVVPSADVSALGDVFEANQNVFKSLPMS